MGLILRDKGNRINILGASLSVLRTREDLSNKMKYHILKYKEDKIVLIDQKRTIDQWNYAIMKRTNLNLK